MLISGAFKKKKLVDRPVEPRFYTITGVSFRYFEEKLPRTPEEKAAGVKPQFGPTQVEVMFKLDLHTEVKHYYDPVAFNTFDPIQITTLRGKRFFGTWDSMEVYEWMSDNIDDNVEPGQGLRNSNDLLEWWYV